MNTHGNRTRVNMKIVIGEQQPIFREGIRAILNSVLADFELIETDNITSLSRVLADHLDIDLVLMDLHIAENTGLSGLKAIKLEHPTLKVAILSATESPIIIYRAIKLGACGYIPKSSSTDFFKQAIGKIIEGERWVPENLSSGFDKTSCSEHCLSEKIASLSPRRFRVLSMISDGKLNKQIAYILYIQEATIKHHVTLILRKLGVINRTGAANMFNRLRVEQKLTNKYEASA